MCNGRQAMETGWKELIVKVTPYSTMTNSITWGIWSDWLEYDEKRMMRQMWNGTVTVQQVRGWKAGLGLSTSRKWWSLADCVVWLCGENGWDWVGEVCYKIFEEESREPVGRSKKKWDKVLWRDLWSKGLDKTCCTWLCCLASCHQETKAYPHKHGACQSKLRWMMMSLRHGDLE